MQINEISCKTVLVKSGLPGSDWVINPYGGCTFGCMYCYAAQLARWKHPNETWGSFLDVKKNAANILEHDLMRLAKKYPQKDFGSIFFSSMTDPYVGFEAKFQVTRACLNVLGEFGYNGKISIQTKSPLVTRDIDLLKKLKNATVGFTITSLDDDVSKFLEGNAPPVNSRIRALAELHKNGVNTYAFVGPVLPYFLNSESKINELLDKLEEVGVTEVWFEHINLSKRIKERLMEYLSDKRPELIAAFEEADSQDYRDNLNKVILKALEGRNMKLALGKVIFHHDLPKK